MSGNNGDAGDAQGRINTHCGPAGGRKVAGSNPAAPTTRKLGSEIGKLTAGSSPN